MDRHEAARATIAARTPEEAAEHARRISAGRRAARAGT